MKMNEPIGHSAWGPFFGRVGLGGYFFLAGMAKYGRPQAFIQEVEKLNILPAPFSTLYAVTLPYAEMLVGALLLIGIFTTFAALGSSLMLASFIFALGIFPTSTPGLFNKDIILLGMSLSLLYTGPGAFSIDQFRRGG